MDIEPKRTALVAIHLQGDVVTEGGAFGGFFAEMVEKNGVLDKAAELIEAGRAAGTPVVYTRIVFDEAHEGLIPNNALFQLIEGERCCVDGSKGTAIVGEVEPRDGDLVIDHRRVSGAHGTQLVDELRARGVDTAVLFGVATNISVEGTARDLVDEGFQTIIVSDCSAAADEDAHAASLGTLGLVASAVTDRAAVIDALAA